MMFIWTRNQVNMVQDRIDDLKLRSSLIRKRLKSVLLIYRMNMSRLD